MLKRMLVHYGLPVLAFGALLGATSPCAAQMTDPGLGMRTHGFFPGNYMGYRLSGFDTMPYFGGYYNSPTYYNYAPNYSRYYIAQPPLAASDMILDVRVPADAKVWVNGDLTTQSGHDRRYITNDLTPGQTYTYSIKARWTENGKPVEYVRKVKVHGGEERLVNFNVPR